MSAKCHKRTSGMTRCAMGHRRSKIPLRPLGDQIELSGNGERQKPTQLVFDVLHEPLGAGIFELSLRDVPAPIFVNLREVDDERRGTIVADDRVFHDDVAEVIHHRRDGEDAAQPLVQTFLRRLLCLCSASKRMSAKCQERTSALPCKSAKHSLECRSPPPGQWANGNSCSHHQRFGQAR